MKTNENIKPTLKTPVNKQSSESDKNFNKTMVANGIDLNEVDGMLNEKEQSLKKKIFNLSKMESLVFSDPKLSAVYDDMSENAEEKYGYHYNETIMNMIFNDFVLNSSKYLQKYKQAIPKKKKRRDKSGINQLRKSGEEKTDKTKDKTDDKQSVDENQSELTKVIFLVNERDGEHTDVFAYFPELNSDENGRFKTSYSHIGQHSACDPEYAKESRLATPEEYTELKNELEGIGYNLDVIDNDINETSTTGSVGGSGMGSGGYVTPTAWGGGDLTGNKKSKIIKKPIWKGGSIIQETNYLIESGGFKKFHDTLIENYDLNTAKNIARQISKEEGVTQHVNQIKDGVYDVSDWFDNNTTVCSFENGRDLNENTLDEHHLNTREDKTIFISTNSEYSIAQLNKFDDNKIDKIYNIVEKKMGLIESSTTVDVNANDSNDKESKINQIINKIDNKGDIDIKKVLGNVSDSVVGEIFNMIMGGSKSIKETDQSMIDTDSMTMANKPQPVGDLGTNVDMGVQVNENIIKENKIYDMDDKIFEELDNELKAFSVHQDKLQRIIEDRKTSSLVTKDRLGGENKKNFKKDLQHSGTKEIINVEKELQWKDQQTDIGNDPQKLSQDIEKDIISKTGGNALKNVGDSTNVKGDEIPKRNMTDDELDEVERYRLGMHSLDYDSTNDDFEKRAEDGMGKELYNKGRKQVEDKKKMPLYNKDVAPATTKDTSKDDWYKDVNLKESVINGKYVDILNKRQLIGFMPKDVVVTENVDNLFKIDFAGLGNAITSKGIINENINDLLNENAFYTDGEKVFVTNIEKNVLNESENKTKKSENHDKIKHLIGYKPKNYISTVNTKRNRGF